MSKDRAFFGAKEITVQIIRGEKSDSGIPPSAAPSQVIPWKRPCLFYVIRTVRDF